ncbi:MAG TPA: LysM peptidoglycan-binding domain-containing protein [Rubricoccaceae bacterium]|jgi:LysM repeat protein
MTRRLLLLAFAVLALAAAPHAQRSGDLYVVQAGDTLYRIARASNLTVDRLRRLNPAVVDDVIAVGQTLRLTDRVAVPAPRPAQGPPSVPGGPAVSPARPPLPAGTPAATRPPVPAGAVTHVVEANDTLFRIAQRYGMPIGELRRLNAIEGDAIQLGQRLTVVPAAGVTPPIRGGVAVNAPPAATAPNGPARVTPPAAATSGRPEPARRTPPRVWSTTDTTVPADLVHFVEPGETLYSIAAAYGFTVDALIGGNSLSTAPLVPGTLLYLPAPVDPSWAASRTLPDVSEAGLALVYPDVLTGRPTASGEPYDPLALTASHRDLPLGTILLVTNPASGRSTFVRVADRGPVSRAYLVELSAAAATALDLDPNAARRVELRLLP